MKKSAIIIFTILIVTSIASAQKVVEKSVKISQAEEVSLNFDFADDITVNIWDKQEVYVKVSVNINENKNNDNFTLKDKKEGNSIVISSEIEDLDKLSEKNDGHIKMELTFEVFMPKNKLLSLNTISGNIEIIDYPGEMDINTISGFIDLSIPRSTKADLSFATISGSIYSDLDNNFDEKTTHDQIIGASVDNTINGGGKKISLNTISGNIYLREKK